MALRITDAQMMMVKPAELTAAQALANRQGGVNVNMAREMDRAVEQEMHRAQATLPAEGARISADAEGGGGDRSAEQGPGPERERESAPPPDELKERLARKMLDLPVGKGKYAAGEEPKIDILV